MLDNLNLEALDKLSPEERAYTLKVLQEISQGNMSSFNNLISSDYKEVPVDIETFLKDPQYLGKGLHTEEGKFTVFPYWVETLKKLFPNNFDTAYNTLILTGAIGLGKSLVAVLAFSYMLYRMLCLKNPYVFYGLQEIDHITYSFLNITMDAAKGVAWSKFQELVQLSPWFLAHGKVSKAQTPEWQPVIDKGDIEVIYGSQQRHVIGRAVFCVTGDTMICTDKGPIAIKDLEHVGTHVYQISEKSQLTLSNYCASEKTKITQDIVEIELWDGGKLRCTPDHKILMSDGKSYKPAGLLTDNDIIWQGTSKSDQSTSSNIRKVTPIHLDEPEQLYDIINAAPYSNFLIWTGKGRQPIVAHNCSFEDEVNSNLPL